MVESIELKDRAKQWYVENLWATMKDVAQEFGIPYDTVRDWAQDHSWTAARIKSTANKSGDAAAQAAIIRSVLFAHIVSGDHNADSLVDLVRAWNSVATVVHGPVEKEELFDQSDILSMIDEANKS